jgi:hypothetical protein
MPTNVTVGDVYRIYARQSKPPKLKRIILVAQDDTGTTFLGVFINSQPNGNIHTAEAIRNFHPKLDADGRSYLEWDSHADCCYPHEYSLNDIHSAMRNNLNSYLGPASSADIAMLQKALIDSPTVERFLKIKYFGESAVKPRRPRIPMPEQKKER